VGGYIAFGRRVIRREGYVGGGGIGGPTPRAKTAFSCIFPRKTVIPGLI
jgi:hypothetical protein